MRRLKVRKDGVLQKLNRVVAFKGGMLCTVASLEGSPRNTGQCVTYSRTFYGETQLLLVRMDAIMVLPALPSPQLLPRVDHNLWASPASMALAKFLLFIFIFMINVQHLVITFMYKAFTPFLKRLIYSLFEKKSDYTLFITFFY